MIFQFDDYRKFLLAILTEARKRNPRFSLRAWAAKIGVKPAMLSAVLNGKKNFSPAIIRQIADVVGLKPREKEYFSSLHEMETAHPEKKAELSAKLDRLRLLTDPIVHSTELFSGIGEWYAIAILEWASLPEGLGSDEELAKRLKLPLLTVVSTRKRLRQFGLIRKSSDGVYRKTDAYLRFAVSGVDQSLRRFHRQMLERAADYLDIHSPDERYIGTETFPFDSALLPEARAVIDRCLDDLVALSRKSKNPDNIFHAGVQFFKLLEEAERKSS